MLWLYVRLGEAEEEEEEEANAEFGSHEVMWLEGEKNGDRLGMVGR